MIENNWKLLKTVETVKKDLTGLKTVVNGLKPLRTVEDG